jgi:hypothetical protein
MKNEIPTGKIAMAGSVGLVLAFMLACSAEKKKEEAKEETITKEVLRVNQYTEVEILQVKGCEYIFLNNGYGSDLEHYAACQNPKH